MTDSADVVEITKVSEKKIEANRRNARLATGPRTETGKNRSRYDAIKHGIFSRDMLQSWGLGKEDAKEFDDLSTNLREELKPVGVLEEALVERIALLPLEAEARLGVRSRNDDAAIHGRTSGFEVERDSGFRN